MNAAVAAKPYKTPWGNRPIDSLNVVFDALKYLDMPTPNREAIALVVSSPEKKGRFKSAIEECLQISGPKAQVSQDTKRYLFGLVACVSDVMTQSLSQLGYSSIPHDTMIYIGSTNGMTFRAAVNAALTKNDPNHQHSLGLVETMLAEASAALNEKSPTRSGSPAAPAAKAAAPAPAPTPNREYPRPASAAPATPAQARETSTEQPIADSGDEDKGFLSTHVYGGKAALCFNAAKSKNKENHTVILDAALAIGERKYDWEKAISIQLGHKELPLLLEVLLGKRNSIKFDAHGAANDKAFEIERQDGKFFAKVFAKGEAPRAVPIGIQDAYPIAMVVFAQIVKQAPAELRAHPQLLLHFMEKTLNIKPVVQ